jgi:putative aminopeptidase FrvX
MPAPDALKRLLMAPGPSGYEQEAAAVFRELAEPLADEVSWDSVGSTVALKRGSGDGPLVTIIGHIDEIGVIVTYIDDAGFLRFRGVGGWDATVLVGQRVVLATKDGPVRGVIARKPVHVLSQEERKQAPELKHLHIDIGANDGDDAKSMVRIGDVGVLDAGDPIDLPNGRLVSKALDNRLGCWVALEVLRLLGEGDPIAADVAAVAATQEELLPHMGGAKAMAYTHRPDVAIVVDVTWETKQPGVELGDTPAVEFGMGPVVTRGPQLHPLVSGGLIDTAETEEIPIVVEAAPRGTFTDADSVYLVRQGIPTALVSVPIRYLHTPVETVDLPGVDAAAQLIAAYLRTLAAGTDFRR